MHYVIAGTAVLIPAVFGAAYAYRVRRSRARDIPPPPWWSFALTALGGLVALAGPTVTWLTAGQVDLNHVTALCGGILMGAGVGISWAAAMLVSNRGER